MGLRTSTIVAAGVGCRDAGVISVMVSENARGAQDATIWSGIAAEGDHSNLTVVGGGRVVSQAKARRGGAKNVEPRAL